LAHRVVPVRTERLELLTRLLRERAPHAVLRTKVQVLAQLSLRWGRTVTTLQSRLAVERDRVERTLVLARSEAGRRLTVEGRALEHRAARLRALGPAQTLARGYSICREVPSGRVLRRAEERRPGDQVEVLLAKGSLDCRVEGQRA
jgi:exodeoxyribonuclease VII large subunit